ncbi:MAG: PilN domain-containing protein [Chloroflexota bacterium]
MQPRKIYRQVPNFNLIPLEYQKPTISFQRFSLRLLLVLVIAAEVFFITNLYQEKSTLEAAIDSTQQEIHQIEERLAVANAERDKAKELETTVEALKKEHQALEDDWSELAIKQADWPQVMAALFQSKPQGVNLSSVKQDGTRVDATGTTSDYAALLGYRRVLLASPAISQIVSLKSEKAETSISFALTVEVKIGGSDG